MDYILHRAYAGKTIDGSEVRVPAGTELISRFECVYLDGNPFCYTTSQVAHEHVSRDDDNHGMERGILTYAIAHSERERYNSDHTRRQRFTDQEIETLCERWGQYLNPHSDSILFNQDFYDADIKELKQMAKELNIPVAL